MGVYILVIVNKNTFYLYFDLQLTKSFPLYLSYVFPSIIVLRNDTFYFVDEEIAEGLDKMPRVTQL